MEERLNMQSPNWANLNAKFIAERFPNCVTETSEGIKLDFDLLKQELLNDVIDGNKERYRLEWPGKREAIVTSNLPTTKTLRPVREDSVDFDTTQNIYIEGDNLEVLKLLQESYLGKIKMIYIDPPYNTGKDFIYKDNFTKDLQAELLDSGQKDQYNQRLVVNPETAGRYHSDWLTMMYPRLKLARNLLTHDGVIFISIDDNEINNLRKICDEIFGEINFINCIAVKMSEASGVKMNHQKVRFPKIKEYILLYKKSDFTGFVEIDKYKQEIWDNENNIFLENFSQADRDFLLLIENKEEISLKDIEGINEVLLKVKRVSLNSKIRELNLNEQDAINWKFENSYRIIKTAGSSSLAKLVADLNFPSHQIAAAKSKDDVLFYFITDYNKETKTPRLQVIFADSNIFKNPCDFWQDIKTTGAIAIEGGVKYTNGKKPLKLLERMIKMTTTSDETILDFFSGSASTAHAVLNLNAVQSLRRKFIMVQVPENLNESLKTATGDVKNTIQETIDFLNEIKKPLILSELGKERIRRSSKKIREEIKAEIDYGFRVYRLDESNMQDVYYKLQDYKQEAIDLFADNVKPDRTADDLLVQVMLDWGLPLSLKIEQINIIGKQVFKVAENSLYACFDKGIDEDFAKAIAKDAPLRIVFRDNGFTNDTAKTNVKQLLKQLSPETEMKVL